MELQPATSLVRAIRLVALSSTRVKPTGMKDWQWYLLYAFVFFPVSLLFITVIRSNPGSSVDSEVVPPPSER